MGSEEDRSETDELDVTSVSMPYRLSASGRNEHLSVPGVQYIHP